VRTAPRLVVILGPTGVGKTECALQLAEELDCEIVSADSRLLYRGMDIGTAKPSIEARRRVPHHLVDVAEPDDTWSLARFQRAALAAILEVHERGLLPLLVGGTGQYVTAILEGWTPPGRPDDTRLRQTLEAEARAGGAESLHARLAAVDAPSAARIDPRNVRRVIRALEVHETTGRPASDQRRRQPPPWRALRLGLTLPRDELYARIDSRIDAMLEAGLVEEVQGLLARGYSPDLPAMSAIGYKQIILHLQGKMTLEEAVAAMRRATRVFVRRQANWFKTDDPRIHWLNAAPDVAAGAQRLVTRWLAEN
jgi:tRNA dimethylallyltransferase